MSTQPPRYRIAFTPGGMEVEAPTKEDCIALLQEAAKLPRPSPIQEAIR